MGDPTEPLLPNSVRPRQASAPLAAPRRRGGDAAQAPSIVGSPFPYLLPRVAAPLVTQAGDGGDATSSPADVEAAPLRRRVSLEAPTVLTSPVASSPPFTTDGDAFFPVDRQMAAPASTPAQSSLGLGITYGLIQAVVCLPTMVSFSFVAYPAAVYAPTLGAICKLAFLSSALHQLVFTLRSSLPFAVGQVQDIGLVVLSAMTTDIARLAKAAHASRAATVATALITLAMATVFVGCALIVLGRAKAASAIQNIPLPVVGGYLAYVGFFCITAGLTLSSGFDLSTLNGWQEFVHNPSHAVGPLAACAAAATFLFIVIKRCRHPAALPAAIIAIPLAFYGVLTATGASLADARSAGWVLPPEPPAPFWKVYELFDPGEGTVLWSAAAAQIPRAIALACVVIFGSCLDVCALLSDLPALDIDTELAAIGVSNIVSGSAGAGLTGSYIFSATLFSMRAGVTHR